MKSRHGQLAPPAFYLTAGGVLCTDGSQADLSAMVRRCNGKPDLSMTPITLRGANIVAGGTARLNPQQAQWARRSGAIDIGQQPVDATLAELLIIGRAYGRAG